MEGELTPLDADEPFQFACSSQVACFNDCCRDLNQFLTPYDILRLKTHLGLTSAQFLEQYTRQHTGPETGMPVVTLKPDYADHLKCPFVSPQGCRVYPDRPSSCRMYPLARAVFRSPQTGRIEERFALVREPHCRGFEEGPLMTAPEWMEQQGLGPYNEMNDRMMALVSLWRQRQKGAPDLRANRIFTMACYDIDAFREYVKINGLPDDMDVEGIDLKTLPGDDAVLLRIAFHWVLYELFDIKESEFK